MTSARVLVVDDDPAICDLLMRVLDEAGHQPFVTGRPEEAMQIATERSFDIAIIDVVLPGNWDGVSLAAKLTTIGVTVLLITGHPDEMQRLEDLSHPCLLKPFRPRNLLRQVLKLLRVREEQEASNKNGDLNK